jgi:uncharacterized protein YqjF (DUF2071 family)
MSQKKQVFLSAEWRDLVMLNYEVDGKLLNDYVPPGTVLDSFDGRTYISLVGFQFRHTKLFGSLRIPFHVDFDEVNLRFYVRRKEGNEDRRGVVFIAEIVPKWAVAQVARLAYGENYMCLPMKHCVNANGASKTAEYAWQFNGAWCKLHAHASVAPAPAEEGSLEQFISEHYWGYSSQGNGHSLEYHVSHTPWNVWTSTGAGFEGDASGLYGLELGKVLQRRPDSAFIADGSPVIVFAGNKIQ